MDNQPTFQAAECRSSKNSPSAAMRSGMTSAVVLSMPHCKSINYNYTGQLCASDYIPPDGGQLDVFDASCDGGKGVSGAFMADLGANGNDNIYNTSTGGASVSNILFAVTEEADDLYGLGNVHTHEDLGADILNHTPVQAVSPNTPKYNYPQTPRWMRRLRYATGSPTPTDVRIQQMAELGRRSQMATIFTAQQPIAVRRTRQRR